jgi:DNA polymerase III gamma/tau subunit
MRYLKEKDTNSMVNELNEIQGSGTPPLDFINGLNEHIRNLLVGSQKGGADLLEVNEELKTRYKSEAKDWDIRDLLRISDILDDLSVQLKRVSQPDILIEMTFFKLLEMDSSLHLDDLIHRINSSNLSGNQMMIGPEREEEKSENESPIYKTTEREKTDTHSKKDVKLEISETKLPAVKNDVNTDSSKGNENGKQENISDSVSEEKPEQNDQGELSLEFIQSKWTDFVHYVSSHKPSVGTILERCAAQNIDQKHLHVSLFDQPKFNFSVLERNKRWISHSLERVISHPVSIKFVFEEKPKESGTIKKKKSNKDNLQSNGKAIVSQIIDVFDGEIIN